MHVYFRTDYLVDFGEDCKVMVSASFERDADGIYMKYFKVCLEQGRDEVDITRFLDRHTRLTLEEEAADRVEVEEDFGPCGIGPCC